MSLIRKKDKVLVMAGKDRGKQGEVVQVLPDAQRVLVAKINFVKRHSRSTQTQPGGIREKEASIHLSNVMLMCKKCNRPMRPKSDRLSDGTKVRICRKCGEMIAE
ncbi:MAG: 50S ribosomal protein L24 [Elusimicrobia bacterium RIFCSPLOWO2_01_FULL_59_12]|nr:MAG: 50S ribosomal protein L24 [Elusimicrobia bacterium RIFCSPLOWO2_01_FULL_59_12]